MSMDKIMHKLNIEHCNIYRKANRIFATDEKAHYDMRTYLAGYDHCYELLEQLIKEDNEFKISQERVTQLVNEYRKMIGQTPPCTGSSVQKIDKLQPSIIKESVPASITAFDKVGNITFTFDNVETFKKSPITNEQLMDKINEIIDVVNGMKGDR